MISFLLVAALASSAPAPGAGLSLAPQQTPVDLHQALRYVDTLFPEVQVTRDIVYARALNVPKRRLELLELDLYEPQGDKATDRWAIVMVHGGSFSSGDKSERWPEYAREFARRGYVAVSINYRLALDDLAQLEDPDLLQTAVEYGGSDTMAAIRWLRANAKRLRLDPERVAAIGSSAGAYGVLAATYAELSDSSNASNAGFDGRPTAAAEISGALLEPKEIEPGEPAICIIHGTQDTTIPFGAALQVAKTCDALGVEHEDVFLAGAGHGLLSSHQAVILERTVPYFLEQLR